MAFKNKIQCSEILLQKSLQVLIKDLKINNILVLFNESLDKLYDVSRVDMLSELDIWTRITDH